MNRHTTCCTIPDSGEVRCPCCGLCCVVDIAADSTASIISPAPYTMNCTTAYSPTTLQRGQPEQRQGSPREKQSRAEIDGHPRSVSCVPPAPPTTTITTATTTTPLCPAAPVPSRRHQATVVRQRQGLDSESQTHGTCGFSNPLPPPPLFSLPFLRTAPAPPVSYTKIPDR